jgi:hypothetical protein
VYDLARQWRSSFTDFHHGLLGAAGDVAQVDADTEAAGRVVIVTRPDGREKA